MTTVACVFVRGHVPFTAEYVTRLAGMVKRWMDRPYRFVCLTDRPKLFKSEHIETVYVEPPAGCFAWWTKLELFNRAHGFSGRMLYLDLDTLVVGSLAPILDYAPFALAPHAGRFEGKNGKHVVKKFNSSVMVWNAGEQDIVWDTCDRNVRERFWGDQDWIGALSNRNWLRQNGVPFPPEWVPRFSELRGLTATPPDAKVILMKTPKNAEAARRYRWVRDLWRAA